MFAFESLCINFGNTDDSLCVCFQVYLSFNLGDNVVLI